MTPLARRGAPPGTKRRVARPRPPPLEPLGPLLAAPVLAALEEMRAAADPAWSGGSWLREVRIGSRRLRMMLRFLVLPRDPLGVKPIRESLSQFQEALSGARDDEVLEAWAVRRAEEPEGARTLMALRKRAAAPEARDLDARPAPDPLAPEGEDPELPEDRRDWVRERLDLLGEQLRDLVTTLVPVGAQAVPGSRAAGPAEERVHPLPPETYRIREPSKAMTRAAASALGWLWREVLAWMPALDAADAHPEDLHQLRCSARRLRYMIEALPDVSGVARMREPVKRFQWLLGQVQDRRVLRSRLAGLAAEEAPLCREWSRTAEEETAGFLAEAREIRDEQLDEDRMAEWLATVRRGGT